MERRIVGEIYKLDFTVGLKSWRGTWEKRKKNAPQVFSVLWMEAAWRKQGREGEETPAEGVWQSSDGGMGSGGRGL